MSRSTVADRLSPGSKRAANVTFSVSLHHPQRTHGERSDPHERSNHASIVAHLAIDEVACHAGGRGFESRRSRFRITLPAALGRPLARAASQRPLFGSSTSRSSLWNRGGTENWRRMAPGRVSRAKFVSRPAALGGSRRPTPTVKPQLSRQSDRPRTTPEVSPQSSNVRAARCVAASSATQSANRLRLRRQVARPRATGSARCTYRGIRVTEPGVV